MQTADTYAAKHDNSQQCSCSSRTSSTLVPVQDPVTQYLASERQPTHAHALTYTPGPLICFTTASRLAAGDQACQPPFCKRREACVALRADDLIRGPLDLGPVVVGDRVAC